MFFKQFIKDPVRPSTVSSNDYNIIAKHLFQDKSTPLHLAAENKSPICVALLLVSGAGASLEVKNEVQQKIIHV